jgi:hypothetical protein
MSSSVRLFQQLAYAWLALYALSLLVLGNAAWVCAPVELFHAPAGWQAVLQSRVNALSAWTCAVLCVVLIGMAVLLIRRHRWWLGLIAWFVFRVITHRLWLASNGGIQLMENMLLWCAFMGGSSSVIHTCAFWIGRLQLALVYAVTAAHKFTGRSWLDGSAVLTVARDPDFHLAWLTASPQVCSLITFSTLAFMTLFPLAVWWSPSRRLFLVIGVLFHLCTAIFMDIPQMGSAFVACYALWLEESEFAVLSRRFPRKLGSVIT